MRQIVKRLVVLSLFAGPVVGGVVVPASPSGAAPAIHVVMRSSAAPATKNAPNSNIIGRGKNSRYTRKALTVSEDLTNGCQSDPLYVSFTLTNKTPKTQYVTYETGLSDTFEPLGTVAPDSVAHVCSTGFGAGNSQVFGLSNAKDTVNFPTQLTVTFTD